jgi:hypothetical protein
MRITLIYSDPVGTLRASVYIFPEVGPGNGVDHITYVQAHSKDIVLNKVDYDRQKEAQRVFAGSQIRFYREFDRGRQTLPLPQRQLPWPLK